MKLKLQGPVVDDYISEGIVQVEHEGKWGYICPSNWKHVNSYVLCGELGFPNSTELESYRETLQDVEPVYWLDQVKCKGWESSIVSCDHAGWVRHQCEDGGALKIKCARKNITNVSPLWTDSFLTSSPTFCAFILMRSSFIPRLHRNKYTRRTVFDIACIWKFCNSEMLSPGRTDSQVATS